MADAAQTIPPISHPSQSQESLTYTEAFLLLLDQLDVVTQVLLQRQDIAEVEQFHRTLEATLLEQFDGFVCAGRPHAELMLRALRDL